MPLMAYGFGSPGHMRYSATTRPNCRVDLCQLSRPAGPHGVNATYMSSSTAPRTDAFVQSPVSTTRADTFAALKIRPGLCQALSARGIVTEGQDGSAGLARLTDRTIPARPRSGNDQPTSEHNAR